MKTFPVTVLDNFYENPELVRDWALSQEYFPGPDGDWPGERTKAIQELNRSFFTQFCSKVLGLYFDLDQTRISYEFLTMFQKIDNYSEDPNSSYNTGWIHADKCLFSGVIYLNPNSDENTGTSVYQLKDGADRNLNQPQKHLLYGGKNVSEREYSDAISKNNDKFEETIRVENKFNRMILFEGNQYHGVPSLYSASGEPRLTQVFFCHKLDTSSTFPVHRSRINW